MDNVFQFRDQLIERYGIRTELPAAITRKQDIWADFDAFRNDPLSIWVELNLGIELPADEPPRRARPMMLEEASRRLAEDAGCQPEAARTTLQRFLVAAHDVRTPQGRPPFAFKLHQFISGPGKVLTTLEARGKRHVTLDAQRFAPGRQQENALLYPTHFCRDCSQEYLPVWHAQQPVSFSSREIDDIAAEDDATRNELRYILDPADIMDEDYPSETFRVLKNKKLKEFGEYRTQPLVLEAWDQLETGDLH